MRVERRYTTEGRSPYDAIAFREAVSEIRNPNGSVVFRQEGIEVPAQFSQVASDILAQKYFRKAGVPARLKKVEENAVPSFLWRSVPDEAALAALPEKERYVGESSPSRWFDPVWPAPGPTGAGRAAISTRRRTRRPSSTSIATCSPCRWWRRTRRSGSTPACTGPIGIDGPGRPHSTSITSLASFWPPPRPMSTPSRMPASSSPWGRRPRERGRHHGPVGARGALFKYGSGTGSTSPPCAARASASRAAASPPAS